MASLRNIKPFHNCMCTDELDIEGVAKTASMQLRTEYSESLRPHHELLRRLEYRTEGIKRKKEEKNSRSSGTSSPPPSTTNSVEVLSPKMYKPELAASSAVMFWLASVLVLMPLAADSTQTGEDAWLHIILPEEQLKAGGDKKGAKERELCSEMGVALTHLHCREIIPVTITHTCPNDLVRGMSNLRQAHMRFN